jgi:hypothetical protein
VILRSGLKLAGTLFAVFAWIVLVPIVEIVRSAAAFLGRPFSRFSR